MLVLGIETSCDETSAAVVADGRTICANVIASQADLHAAWGGVVPEVASRQHVQWIVPVIRAALDEAGCRLQEIAAVAVTRGPGLAGSLLVGLSAAKALAFAIDKPLLGVNHLEGHIYANWLGADTPEFPLICLIVSGGHTDLIYMPDHLTYQRIGGTRDDAAGEAFDKVARILGLGYPGGPAIERAAAESSAPTMLPRAWLPETFDFSFSGLKAAVARLAASGQITDVAAMAAGFQDSVVDVLIEKTANAAAQFGARTVLLAGGVAANQRLCRRLAERLSLTMLVPTPRLCTDNAAMIAAAAHWRITRGERHDFEIDVSPNLRLI
jgi:N6-L-threonylcarbamoyladenine synthase